MGYIPSASPSSCGGLTPARTQYWRRIPGTHIDDNEMRLRAGHLQAVFLFATGATFSADPHATLGQVWHWGPSRECIPVSWLPHISGICVHSRLYSLFCILRPTQSSPSQLVCVWCTALFAHCDISLSVFSQSH
jgi:hypothetical protein